MKTLTVGLASFVLALGFVCLPACSNIIGITDLPTGEGGAPSVPSGLFDPTPFIGTWTITTGSNIVSCPGSPATTTTDTGSLLIQRGSSSDIVTTSGTCVLGANLTSATTATLIANQSCSEPTNDGTGQITISPSGTFSLNSTGKAGIVTFSGSATDVDQGTSVTCSFTQTDQYAKD